MKEIQPYEQRTTFSCGPASLLIAYHALGVEYSEENLAVELGLSKDGAEWLDLVRHADGLGFPTELKLRAKYRDLKRDFKQGVMIVGWNTDWGGEPAEHYAVVSGITKDLIELTDPGIPASLWPSIMEKGDFIAKWQNSYLLIKPKT